MWDAWIAGVDDRISFSKQLSILGEISVFQVKELVQELPVQLKISRVKIIELEYGTLGFLITIQKLREILTEFSVHCDAEPVGFVDQALRNCVVLRLR